MSDPTYSTTALTNSVTLGKDCELNVGGGKLNGVTSVSISCEADEIDVSTRDDNGFAKSLPGKKTVSLDIEFKRIAADAGQNNIYAAWKGGTFIVTSLSESQDMDDAVSVSASLKNYGEVTLA